MLFHIPTRSCCPRTRHNVRYDFFVHVMTSYRSILRRSFGMAISHMAASQSEAMNCFKKIIFFIVY